MSGSADGSIRVWDADSGQCLRVINTYSSVWSLQILADKIVSLLALCLVVITFDCFSSAGASIPQCGFSI